MHCVLLTYRCRDQWLELKGPHVAGYTYDARKNLMLKKIQRAKKAVSPSLLN